jgi:predicted phage terminase large subunit-like protein
MTAISAIAPITPIVRPPDVLQRKADVYKHHLARRQATTDLIQFTVLVKDSEPYMPAAHHHLIARKLEAVEAGTIKRLMIFCPPRAGKSEIASRKFPAWYLGKHPERQVISASYNNDLASDFGRDVRNLVASRIYQGIFPGVELAADSQAANKWHTNRGGVYVAAGVGSTITGRGAHLAIIDDPIKDQEEADSETVRNKVWDWYRSVLYTRLMPGGAIVLIMTRWHDDDLAGRLLQEMEKGGDQWEVISLPAMAQAGDPMGRAVGAALWPAWFPLPALEQTRRVLGPRKWSALYQQEPISEEGDFFKREWVKYYDEPPATLRYYMSSDYATKDGSGDYTAYVVAGTTPSGDIYLVDFWMKQTTSDVWIDVGIDLGVTWKTILWAEEAGPVQKAVAPHLVARMNERQVAITLKQYPSIKEKTTRARAIQARMSLGKVYIPRNAEWTAEFVKYLLRFPAGTIDDSVDAFALLGRMVEDMQQGPLKNWDAKRHTISW